MPKRSNRHRSKTRSRSPHTGERLTPARDYPRASLSGSRDRSRRSQGLTRGSHDASRNCSRDRSTRRSLNRSPNFEGSSHKHNNHCCEPRRESGTSRRPASRPRTPPRAHSGGDNVLQSTLDKILTRLDVIENFNVSLVPTSRRSDKPEGGALQSVSAASNVAGSSTNLPLYVDSTATLSDGSLLLPVDNSEGPPSTRDHVPAVGSSNTTSDSSVNVLAEAIKSLQTIKSRDYYVSNFDPTLHDIDLWCSEVDRAMTTNHWSDQECLSRVASCLKGDAKIWLNEWVSNDRTWSNFKIEFKPLCPRRLDYANILFDTMKTTSDKFTTYAEYARRTLLRLRIVKGLSDELRTCKIEV